jgi:hypothetical protein
MFKKSRRTIHGLFPRCVENSFRDDIASRESIEDYRRMQIAVKGQIVHTPDLILKQRILARIKYESTSSVFKIHPYALVLAFVVCVLLWAAIRPGIALQWNVTNDSVQKFRIYRAVQGETEYRLISELPASGDLRQYSYVDMLMLPWQSYSYVVVGIREGGNLAPSEVVTGRAIEALPGQLALISASLFMGYLITYIGGYIFSITSSTRREAA